MKCVKCTGTLRRIPIDDIEVDRCDTCSGLWFDAGELRRVLGTKSIDRLRSKPAPARGEAPAVAPDARRGSCPRCKGAGLLVQIAQWDHDIHVDTCAVCGGQWLDAGELELLRGEGTLFGSLLERVRRLVS
ncbi:TFIIB-type zinc ribbon-containing protein [Chondromyces apiculatus]|nr:zf-TFIIB domain-containing protein [Chondromyces apiculatus]